MHVSDSRAEQPIQRRETVFSGAIWNVTRDTFAFTGAGAGAAADAAGAAADPVDPVVLRREYVQHPGAVSVLVLDDADRVLLIKQYRHPVGALDWEIPAGLLDVAGESALDAAKRELAEEVDLVASEWAVLAETYTSPGGSSETIRVFLARGVSEAPAFARTGEEATMVKAWVPLEDAVTAVLERRVQNGVLCSALLAAYVAKQRGFSTLGDSNEPWVRREWLPGAQPDAQPDAHPDAHGGAESR